MHIQSAERGTVTSRTTRQLKRALAMAAIAGAMGLSNYSWADTLANNGGTTLNSAGSWINETPGGVSTVPGATDIAAWDINSIASAPPATTITYTLGADTTWAGILVKNPAAGVVIDAPQSNITQSNLTLGGAGIDMSLATQNLTIDPASFTLSASQTWNVALGRTLTLAGPPAGPNSTLSNSNFGVNLLTVTGAGNTVIQGTTIISSTGGLLKTGNGMLEIDGAVGFTNQDSFGSSNITINGGMLRVAAPTGTNLNTINPNANIVLGGGVLQYFYSVAAPSTQSFANLTINAGESVVRPDRNGGFNNQLIFNGTAITRNIGGTLAGLELDTSRRQTVFPNIGNNTLITSNGVAYVTLGMLNGTAGAANTFSDWARIDVNHNLNAVIYTPTTATTLGTAAQNANVAVATTTLAANATIASFRDALNGASLINLNNNTLTTGGILVTADIKTAGSAISNGSLMGPAGQDLVVFVDAPATSAVPFTISANIVDNVLSGVGSALTKGAAGTLIISGANTFTNGVYINDGTLQLGSAGALNASSPNAINFDGSGGSVAGIFTAVNATPPTLALGGFNTTVASISSANLQNGVGAVIENANGASVSNAVLTVNGSASTTFSGTIQNGSGGGTLGLTMSGTGTLTLLGTNTYTGNTNITSGKLAINHSLASSVINVGSGATLDASAIQAGFSIASSKTLMGSGTVLGTTVLGSGGIISPGDPAINTGVGTINVGSLTLKSNSFLNFDIGASSNDLINVMTPNGLALNGVAGSVNINLFQAGTSTGVSSGTYDLFQYLGNITGTGLSALTDFNVPDGFAGTFGTATIGGLQYITVTIAPGTATSPTWIASGSGNWNDSTKWNTGSVPSGAGVKIILGSAITGNSTIDLGSVSETVGGMTFDKPTASYTIAATGGASLVLDNGASAVSVALKSGTHVISAPVILNSNASFVANGGNLTISGVVSEATPGQSVILSGAAGTVALMNANTYTGGTVINGATLQVGNNTSLGNGPVTFGDDSSLQSGASNLILANNIAINSGVNVTVNTLAQTMTLSGVISSADATGTLNKNGSGILVLTGANTFSVPITISQGTLQLGDGVSTTTPIGTQNITNNGSLSVNTVANMTLSNTISGTGSLTMAGHGNGTNILTLNGPNSFSGGLTIGNGFVAIKGNANQQSAVGTGPITLQNGGGLYMNGFDPNNVFTNANGTPPNTATGTDNGLFYGPLTNPITIANGATATLGLSQRGAFSGSMTGAANTTLNLDVQYVRDDTSGDWSNFLGTVNVVPTVPFGDVTNTPSGDFRLAAAFNGSKANFILNANTTTYATIGGLTIQLGHVTGTGTIGQVNAISGLANFQIGALDAAGTTDTFLGAIQFGNTITKVGLGTLDLAGANSFTGGIAVQQGILNFANATAMPATNTSINMGGAGTTLANGTISFGTIGTLDLTGFSFNVAALTTSNLTGAGNVIGNSSNTTASTITFAPAAFAVSTFFGNIVDHLGTGNQTVALVVSGSQLNLSGTNTYTGGTTINSNSTLQMGAGGTTGSIVGPVTDNGVLAFNYSNQTFSNVINGNGSVDKVGTGITMLTGANTYSGVTRSSGGTLSVASLTIVGSGGTPSPIGTSSNAAANLIVNAGGTFQYAGPATTTDRLFTVSSTGGSIDASGTGAIVFSNTGAIVSGDAQTRTANTNGVAATATVAAIPNAIVNGFTVMNDVSDLVVGMFVTGTNIPANDKIASINAANNSFTLTAPAAVIGADTISFSPVSRTLGLTGTSTAANTINGVLGDSALGGVLSVTKSGPGTWVLTAANTYTGATRLNGGILRVAVLADGGASSNIGSSTNAATNLVFSGATLQYTGSGNSTDRLFTVTPTGGTLDASGTGALVLSNIGADVSGDAASRTATVTKTTTAVTGLSDVSDLVVGMTVTATNVPVGDTIASINTATNSFTLATAATGTATTPITFGLANRVLTLTGTNTAANTITGVLADSALGGKLGVTKTGAGSWTLAGANTYTGNTTVNGGSLYLNGTGGAGAIVLNGGTLGGTGVSAGAITPGTAAHTVNPGLAGSVGTLTVGGLTTSALTTLAFDLTSPAGTSDRLAVNGPVSLNGGKIAIASLTSTGAGSLGYYKVISYTGALTVGTPAMVMPTSTTPNIVYTLDTTHDANFIDIHRGFLGDTNDNGVVNLDDLDTVLNNLGVTTSSWSLGNFDGAATVNVNDLTIVLNNLGATIPAGANVVAFAESLVAGTTATPEPTSLGILALGAGALLTRRRKASTL